MKNLIDYLEELVMFLSNDIFMRNYSVEEVKETLYIYWINKGMMKLADLYLPFNIEKIFKDQEGLRNLPYELEKFHIELLLKKLNYILKNAKK